MIDLGTLGGAVSLGFGINDGGEVTGNAQTTSGEMRAFIYTSGAMYDLNQLVVSGMGAATLIDAKGINNNGQIVATGCINGSSCQAYRLDPVQSIIAVPVPTSSIWTLAVLVPLIVVAGVLLRRYS